MHEAVFEVLTRINNLDNDEQRIGELRKTNKRIQELLKYAFDESDWGLPEGAPPFKTVDPIEAHGVFWQEIRRLYIFFKQSNLPKFKLEGLFIEMLENIHPQDAALLISLKDHNWPYENITRDVVDLAFPLLFEE